MHRFLAVVLALVFVACSAEDPTRLTGEPDDGSGDDGVPADAPVVPVDDTPDQPLPTSVTPPASAPSSAAAVGEMTASADLPLRAGPATTSAVLMVIPAGSTVELLDTKATGGFYNVRFHGTGGWAATKYLEVPGSTTPDPPATPPPPSPPPPSVNDAPSPDNAILRAKASVGFSYWWGGGAWVASGASSSNKGHCSGNCPSCSHSGKFGADCSGMVSKAWQFGKKELDANSHAYSTSAYVHDAAGKWSTVSRKALKRGDAMVYNSGGGGHIVLWEKGDGYGASTVYECKGCSYGCVHNTRTFTSSYHGIRRAGF